MAHRAFRRVAAAVLAAALPVSSFAGPGRVSKSPPASLSGAPHAAPSLSAWTPAQKAAFLSEFRLRSRTLLLPRASPEVAPSGAADPGISEARAAARAFLMAIVSQPEHRAGAASVLTALESAAAAASDATASGEASRLFLRLNQALQDRERLGLRLAPERLLALETAWNASSRFAPNASLDALFENAPLAPRSDGPAVVMPPLTLPRKPSLKRPEASVPAASRVLERAREAGISLESLGRSLEDSNDAQEAAATLEKLGLLDAAGLKLSESDNETAFRYLLRRLWFEAAPHLPARYEIDRSWDIPSVVVRKDGVAYHIHGVVHGQVRGAHGRTVRRLVRHLKEKSLPLYSEQNFPSAYGYTYGKETLDHEVKDWKAAVVPAVLRAGLWPLERALGLLWRVAFPVYLVLSHPDSLWAWAALSLFAALNAVFWTSAFPLLKLKLLRAAAKAEAAGASDIAHDFRVNAKALYGKLPDPELLRRLDLPSPLGMAFKDEPAKRSIAMAEAVLRDTSASKPAEVHVLVGVNHLWEIAWTLRHR